MTGSKKKVLIVGSGGREHVLAWKLKRSPQVSQIYCAPGNGGIGEVAECVDIPADDINELAHFVKAQKIDLTVVGPEAPLVEGIVDVFESENLKIFGPSQKAAQLEGSKVFAKDFMRRHHIPTADFEVFDSIAAAKDYLSRVTYPVVIKADGLAAGKGVMVCGSREEAEEALDQIMEEKIFQDAGNRVVIEECLTGQEASILAISDGQDYVVLDSAQDHKRIFDDDLGPNTGGMGAYSPAAVITPALRRQIDTRIIEPTIVGMLRDGVPFKGVLYAGLMITPEGPKVLEFNVRFGDPETQAVLPRLKNDLFEVLWAGCEGELKTIDLAWDPRACVCVVMSSGGYPGKYDKGFAITGLEGFGDGDVMVFHAGTKKKDDVVVTSGGRVLGVTGLGPTIEEAITTTYEAVEKIQFDRCFFRRDIGAKAMANNAGCQVPGA